MEAEPDITRCATMQRWAQLNSRQISSADSALKWPKHLPSLLQGQCPCSTQQGRLIPHASREANLKSSDLFGVYLTVQAALLTTNLCCTVLMLHHARASQRPRKLKRCQAYSALPSST